MSRRWRWRDAATSSDSPLPATQRLVAVVMSRYATQDGTVWVTNDVLAAKTGLSLRTVINKRNALTAAGWLTVLEPARQHRATVYLLSFPSSVHAAGDDPADDVQGCNPEPPGVQPATARGATGAPNTDTPGNTPSTRPRGGAGRNHPTDTGRTGHPHEPTARAALQTVAEDPRCPIPVPELLDLAYRVGRDGDPWDGYLRLKPALTTSLDGARAPLAVLRSRLATLTRIPA